MMSPASFHPLIAQWFADTLGTPTRAQRAGWDAIRDGRHTLIAAPTGSGKTLAAFLTALDDLVREACERPLPDEVRIVYVSPLKALSADIHKNLAEPRRGIRRLAEARGMPVPRITAAVRTGDTTTAERAAMLRTPPHILVTTPESLYLLLTAERSREMLHRARIVIVDEIHAVIGTRRGAHLALTLERLQQVVHGPLLRLGLSATQKPTDEVARFLVGAQQVDRHGAARCAVIDEGHRRQMDLTVEVPRSPLEAVMAQEVWTEYYERLVELIEEHRTTLVFVNTRRMAERLARQLTDRLGHDAVTTYHGSLSKETRLDAEQRLKMGRLRALVATSSLELGIDIGTVDLVCQIGSPRRIANLLQRVGRSGHTVSGTPKGRLLPMSRDDLVECAALLHAVRRGELDRIVADEAPLDVLAQQVVAETACAEYAEDELYALMTRAWPYRALPREDFDAVLAMTADGFATRRGRRGALVHRDEVHRRVRARRGARLLAITSGGAIPEVADYRVVLEPEETFIGTLNEDFAIESMAGDVFQLGNASWRVLQVAAGVVRVADAKGAPPNIPFWLGEAPGRSDELSRAVSELRRGLEEGLLEGPGFSRAIQWLTAETGLGEGAAEQIVAYLADAHRALGALPTQQTLILERFFDESGGMQLVLHAPFGSRINRAWGLALRKRFCRQFNFELQAAATDDGVLLSLGPQHSFPLADVFRYLHPASARDVLVQALLDAPMFQTRWRWNTTISLAVPRHRGGRKVAPQLQRMLADDLMAAVFPDAAACLENIPGDREIPNHPLVTQTVRDCLEQAMDYEGLAAVLARIHAGELALVSRDLPEPSPLAHEILNARPYAFLDDAPLEERRAQAVYTRRSTAPTSAGDLGALDRSAIDRVRAEARPDPRDADELHDALLTVGLLTGDESPELSSELFARLAAVGRATRVRSAGGIGGAAATGASGPHTFDAWVAAERLPEVQTVHADLSCDPALVPPASRLTRRWSRADALLELVRGRMTIAGPTTAAALASMLRVSEREVDEALQHLESEGVVLRGRFTPPGSVTPQQMTASDGGHAGATNSSLGRPMGPVEWCDRRLLARIHRYTLNRLRAEIEPVSQADFMRFLFAWQHVHPSTRLTGTDGLLSIVDQLHGYDAAAMSWERVLLPSRLERYEPSMLDMLSLTGQVGWVRPPGGTTQLVGATPIALFRRDAGEPFRGGPADAAAATVMQTPGAERVLEILRVRGALFLHEIAAAGGLTDEAVREALAALAGAGLVVSDGFAGLRALLPDVNGRRAADARQAGRWSLTSAAVSGDHVEGVGDTRAVSADDWLETQALWYLRRYGVLCRAVLARESSAAPWRLLARACRRLELRGVVRGGRFVAGLSGEQFALPDAVTGLREVRRSAPDGRLLVISAADPLNLVGLVTPGERIRSAPSTRIAFRDGVPLAVMEGDYIRPLAAVEPARAGEIATALAGRPVPPVMSGYVGRAGEIGRIYG